MVGVRELPLVRNVRARLETKRIAQLEWPEFRANALESAGAIVDRVLDVEIAGATIHQVLTPDEVARGLEGLAKVPDSVKNVFGGGLLLGMALGEMASTDLTPYFDNSDRARALIGECFGFDLHERVAAVVSKLAPGEQVARAFEGDRFFNPGQVRWFEAGRQGLPAHIGTEFYDIGADGAMKHLAQLADVPQHLSYFLVLQQPMVGGSLSVFHLNRDQYRTHTVPWGNSDRDDSWFETVPRRDIDPPAGSMIVFGGGWHWHRVEPISGFIPRITYGGFFARSMDRTEKTLYFWT